MPEEIKATALVQDVILEQIADKKQKRNDIVKTYIDVLAVPYFMKETIELTKINKAIIDRWSMSGLEYILKKAWKRFKPKKKNVLINNFNDFRGCSKDW